jgi:hypothetical protein
MVCTLSFLQHRVLVSEHPQRPITIQSAWYGHARGRSNMCIQLCCVDSVLATLDGLLVCELLVRVTLSHISRSLPSGDGTQLGNWRRGGPSPAFPLPYPALFPCFAQCTSAQRAGAAGYSTVYVI